MEYHVRPLYPVYFIRYHCYVIGQFGQFDQRRVGTASTRYLLIEDAEMTIDSIVLRHQRCLGDHPGQGGLQTGDPGLQSLKGTGDASLVIFMLTVLHDLVTKIFDF